MKYIKQVLFLNLILFIFTNSINAFDENRREIVTTPKRPLPFGIQLSLDLLKLELEHYGTQFRQNFSTNVHLQVIIEEAEILVQTAALQLQKNLKDQIVALFRQYNIFISFSNDNKIMTQTLLRPGNIKPDYDDRNDDDDDDDDDYHDEDATILEKKEEKKLKLPKKHKKKKNKAHQIVAPKKIHGARRTMNRLKKEAEEQRKREYEAIKARLAAKKEAILHAKQEALLQEERLMREHIMQKYAATQNRILNNPAPVSSRDLPETYQ